MADRRILAILAALPLLAGAQRVDPSFAGAWRIDSSVIAPWATLAETDAQEARTLPGKRVNFGTGMVSGPSPLACSPPRYSVRRDDGPDMLFQGMLASTDSSGHQRNARALARGLGMTTATVATLDPGCGAVEFHAIRPGLLAFALNNRIYFLKRLGK